MYQPTRSRLAFRRRLLEVLLALWVATWALQQYQQSRSMPSPSPEPPSVNAREKSVSIGPD